MKATIRNIISSKTKWWHLLFLLVVTVLSTAFIYIYLIPIIFWSVYGESASADRIASLPIFIFIGEWSPLIIAFSFLGFGLWLGIKGNNFSRAKSYLLTDLMLLPIYMFRDPVFYDMFSAF